MTTLTIAISKQEKQRLARLALRYGLSLADFSRHILQEIASDIPEESLADYTHPQQIKASLARALRDWKKGKISTAL